MDMSSYEVAIAQIALDNFSKTGCEKEMFSLMGMENGCKCSTCDED